MHGQSGLLFPGKVSSRSTDLPCFFLFLCTKDEINVPMALSVFRDGSAVFSCFYTTGCDAYSFTTDGYGIVNVRTNLGAVHTKGGSGTNKSARDELTRRYRKLAHPAPPGD